MTSRKKSSGTKGAGARHLRPPAARRVERVRRLLVRSGMPRAQMSLILASTGAAGFLASFLMLRLGLSLMWLRYALAVLLAYAVFLLLLRLWLLLHSREPLADALDLPLELMPGDFGGASVTTDAPASTFGGGGDFGGGGAGGSWGGGVSAGVRNAAPSFDAGGAAVGSGGGGVGGGGAGGGSGVLSGLDVFDADSEGCVFFLLALALVAAGTVAALYVVYAAPLLLAEILVEGLLLSGLYRGMKRAGRSGGDWVGAAVRRTWLPVLLTLVTFAAAGYFLQRAAPRARSLGEAWKMVNTD
ncbi:MAG TPA: hypothetical protein VF611_06515 [Pyrinomonadaceae bacterium]|jgi:hypothetical protein